MPKKHSLFFACLLLAASILPFSRWSLPVSQAQTVPNIRTINLVVNEIVYDPVSRKIYASVPSSAGANGNSITVIDPATGNVGPSIFVGSEPNRLALSDDGRYLYVGLDGAAAVRRFNLQTLSPELQFTLGNDTFGGPFLAADLAVMPGCAETVLIARATSSSSFGSGIRVYDNGVQRGPANPSENIAGNIAFGTSATTAFVFGSSDLRRATITRDGLRTLDTASGLLQSSSTDIKVGGNLLFTPAGRVIDPVAKSLLGTFSISSSALVEPDTAQGKVFFLSSASGQAYRVTAFNRHTFLSAGSFDVPNVSGTPRNLTRFGRDGLAFAVRGTNSQVFLITSPTVIGSAADTAITSAASFRTGSSAADAITTFFGASLTATTAAATALPLPTTLGGASVKVRDNAGTEREAPLFFVSPTQINFLLPAGSIPGPAMVTVTGSAGTTTTGATHITTVALGIFTANADGAGAPAGIALRVKANGAQEVEPIVQMEMGKFAPRPIDLGPDLGANSDRVFLVLFGTGLRGRSGLASALARIGCDDAMIAFAGAQGALVGVDQINLLIPRSQSGRGELEVALTVDGATANPVRINIK